MKYNELDAKPNANKKRVGRGISAGQGKTAGRGTKGQKARTGKKLAATFMGGQGSLMQRVPKKRGFTSMRAPAQVVYLNELEGVKVKVIDNASLYEAGLVNTPHHTVKVIARGELTRKVTLHVQAASAGAVAAIEKAGGTFEKIAVPLREQAKSKE